MREKSNFGSMAVILICAIGVGLLVGWLALKEPKGEIVPPPTASHTQSNSLVSSEETNVPVEGTNTAEPVVEVPTVEPETEEVNAENWNDKLTDVLASDKMDEDQKADKLADMISKVPEAAQVEIAEHLVNLVADENYKLKASKILVAETTPGSVSSVLFNDLMNRSDDLRLPLTLEIAKNKNHPLHGEAMESLEMSLTEEFGEDWSKWEKAIQESLKEQGLLDTPVANPAP